MIRVSTANLYLNSEASINADQTALMNSVTELSSGKQINSPADNPVGAAQAALLQSNLTQLGSYTTNQGDATSLLNNASSTLSSAINVMQSVRTTLVEAGNGTMSDSDRAALAAQLQQSLNQLVGLGNTSDGQGGYLFSGSVNNALPFLQSGNNVTYQGNNVLQAVQISQTRTEQVKYSGQAVFMNVPTGNGTFVTGAASTNTGTGNISEGSVTSPSALTGDSYTITIGGSPGALTYSIQDTTNASNPINSDPTYQNVAMTPPTTLNFDGTTMQITGTPAAGDTFTVAPAGTQSVFSMIAAAITALQTPTTSSAVDAQRTQDITAALANTDQAITNLSTTQSSMGAQLAELNTYASVNSDRTLQAQTQMSGIVDLNYAQGASQLSQQQTEYQAALQSYSAVSKLSLFNYI